MTHLDPDRLADRALGTDDPLTAAEQNHLAGCPECRDQLAELSRIAELSHHPEELAHSGAGRRDVAIHPRPARQSGTCSCHNRGGCKPPPSPRTSASRHLRRRP